LSLCIERKHEHWFISGLQFGTLGPKTLHVCIDVQLMFALETKWASEAIGELLPLFCQRRPGKLQPCGEKAALHQVFSRFDQHIEVISTVELFRNWLNNL
jgi:hypothetical protein